MRFILALGFINGLLFLGAIWWLIATGFPPVGAIVILVLSSFTTGLLFGGDE